MDDARPRTPARKSSGRGRLSRSAEFERVYRQGRSHGNRHLVVYTFPREGQDEARLGLSVSRKVGGAVDRNRVKRLLREAFAEEAGAVDPDQDIVVVARPASKELAEREGLSGMREALRDALKISGPAQP